MIRVYYLDTPFRIKGVKRIKEALLQIAFDESMRIESWEVSVCSSTKMIELNNQILNHDYDTDNICFNYSDEDGVIDGESFIGIGEIERNASHYKHSKEKELHKVLVHSLLHLCGYDDSTDGEKEMMNNLENQYLKKYF